MPGPFQAGQKLTAAALDSFAAPLAVIKPSDQSVTSSTTLVNDTALVVPVVASATYLFDCFLDYEGGTLGAADLKISWSVPAGATLRYDQLYRNTSGNPVTWGEGTNGAGNTMGTGGAGTRFAAIMKGSLVMSSTAGSLQLQWAQSTSSATATIVHAQSFLALWRIT